jgi:hypothetical protein
MFSVAPGRGTSREKDEGGAVMTYEVRSGGRPVAHLTAISAQEALSDYMKALGCRDAEIVRMGSGVAAWRGAVFSAVPAEANERSNPAA